MRSIEMARLGIGGRWLSVRDSLLYAGRSAVMPIDPSIEYNAA